jgi:hypothetical protein
MCIQLDCDVSIDKKDEALSRTNTDVSGSSLDNDNNQVDVMDTPFATNLSQESDHTIIDNADDDLVGAIEDLEPNASRSSQNPRKSARTSVGGRSSARFKNQK